MVSSVPSRARQDAYRGFCTRGTQSYKKAEAGGRVGLRKLSLLEARGAGRIHESLRTGARKPPLLQGPERWSCTDRRATGPRLLEERGRASPWFALQRRVSRRIAFRLWPAAGSYAP